MKFVYFKMRYVYFTFFTLLLASCFSTKKTVEKTTEIKLSSPQVTASGKELVRITDDVVAEFQPSLSPDGKKLLYVIRDDSQSENDRWSIRLKNNVMLPGFTPLIGKKTGGPSWMGNNEDFIFIYYASNPVIATSNINRLGITYVGQNAYGDFDNDATVSPDGDKVALTTTISGSTNMCLVNIDGSSFTVLSEGMTPQWHKSGKTILYSKLSGDYYQLFELNMESYQSTQITTGSFHSYNGTYSPDGEHIAFISNKDNKYGHLFVMKRNGQSITQITSGNSNEVQPHWGTDGYIYFASTAGAKKPKEEKEENKKSFNLFNLKKGETDEQNTNSITDLTSFKYSDIWRVRPLIVK